MQTCDHKSFEFFIKCILRKLSALGNDHQRTLVVCVCVCVSEYCAKYVLFVLTLENLNNSNNFCFCFKFGICILCSHCYFFIYCIFLYCTYYFAHVQRFGQSMCWFKNRLNYDDDVCFINYF